MEMDKFIEKIQETYLIYDELDLREFAQEYFQNRLDFETNKNNFLYFIENN